MAVSYRTKQDHLQINCTPADYVYLMDQKKKSMAGREAYLAVLPRYLISRCPFCAASHTAQVDTYSLDHWNSPILEYGTSFGNREAEQIGCQHFNLVQRFINLEGIVPVDRQWFESIVHMPFVMPFYLPDDVPTLAVIHSLPVCRIEATDGGVYNFYRNTFCEPIPEIRFNTDRTWKPPIMSQVPFDQISTKDKARLATARFVPRYTGFAVTYYTLGESADLVEKYIDSYLTEAHLRDPDYTAADLRTMADMEEMNRNYPEGYNLADWVRKGKLQWLDLDDPDLPLKADPVEAFPYTEFFNLKGKRIPFFFRHDRFL